MERTNRIQQIYGYLVCLVCIITLLICATTIVNAALDLARPGQADYSEMPRIQSYDTYRTQRLNSAVELRTKGGSEISIPTESEMKSSYEQEKTEDAARQVKQVERAQWRATKSLLSSSLMLILAIVLFSIHWRWLRGSSKAE